LTYPKQPDTKTLDPRIFTRVDWLGRLSRDGVGMCYYTKGLSWH
jgi:hypothetical protein